MAVEMKDIQGEFVETFRWYLMIGAASYSLLLQVKGKASQTIIIGDM